MKLLLAFALTAVTQVLGLTLSGRIVGGDEVQPHSIPYQVGLYITTPEGDVFCGGSLINPKTVLTAAGCVDSATSIRVILGAHKLDEDEPQHTVVNTSTVIIHPAWDSTFRWNNIAIVKINPVQLNNNIGTVPLPVDANKNYLGDIATASGWGIDSDNSDSVSKVLRKVSFPVIGNIICSIAYLGLIQANQICTSGLAGKSICLGDEGGPLVASTGELIGVASFGNSLSCEVGWPSVFSRVSSYLNWISKNSN